MPNFGLSAFFYLDLDTTRQHGKANRVGGIPEAYVSRGNGLKASPYQTSHDYADYASTHVSDSRRFDRQQGIRIYDSTAGHSLRS